jgi:ElaB/YqjD/DUF883 family membrane-anchored ribosome-binding protein
MDKESDVIKHQMEHTRAALTDKLELLENKVTSSVSGAAETVDRVRQTVSETVSGAAETVASMKHAIDDTVASVKECARETAETVSETLDIRKQVEKHPWAMMAGATAVGFGVGVLVSRSDVREAATSAASSMASSARSMTTGWSRHAGDGYAGDHSPGWTGPQREQRAANVQPTSQEESPWMPAANKLKGLAIGTMFGVLRDVLSKSMPQAISGQMGEVIDDFTMSLGGKPIRGKVLPDSWNGNRREHERQPEEMGREWQASDAGWQGGSRRPRQTTMADIEE